MSRLSELQVRKDMLAARAEIERMELQAHLQRVRQSAGPGELLKSFVPKLASGPGVTAALNAWGFLRRHPVVSSAASMLLTRVRPRGIFRLLKLGGGAAVAYQAYKFWRAIQDRPVDPR